MIPRSTRVLPREVEPIIYDIYEVVYYGELTHIIIDGEKPHNLPSAHWRLKVLRI
jgi:hypothetical protein